MIRIFLVGYMGAGKTTLGRELSKILDVDFIDLDHFIEARYKKTINTLFAEYGETKFREIESSILKEVSCFENVIVSTGGGTPCFYDNMLHMNEQGTTIYLHSSPQALAKRLNNCKEKRPLIKDKDEKELLDFISTALDARTGFYRKSHLILDVEEFSSREDAEKFAAQIVEKLNLK